MIDKVIEAAVRDVTREFRGKFFLDAGGFVDRLLREAAEAGYWLGYLAGRREVGELRMPDVWARLEKLSGRVLAVSDEVEAK